MAANPAVGNLMDKLEPLGVHLCFGETSELTGAEKVCATRGATKEASDKFMKTWSAYNDFILKEATNDLSESQPTAGLAAIPEVVSDSPHLTEIHKSLKGHSCLCFSEAH